MNSNTNSTHPFFVNQRPYLPTASSSKGTIYSASSVYSPESNTTHARTTSTTSVNTISSDASISSTSTSNRSYGGESEPIDRECLRWMQRESDAEHIFGSVSSRGGSISMEERSVRRRALEDAEGKTEAAADVRAIKAERRKGRVGKWF